MYQEKDKKLITQPANLNQKKIALSLTNLLLA